MKAGVPDVTLDEARPAVTIAFAQIAERFEGDKPVFGKMDSHNTIHTAGVLIRATSIARALELSLEETADAQIASAFHDVFLLSRVITGEGGASIRMRSAGLNETSSANEAASEMDREGFSPLRIAGVSQAIIATTTKWMPGLETVFQPLVIATSDLVTLAVGLADLGSAGMDPNQFARDGYELFAEDQFDLMHDIRHADSVKEIPEKRQEWYRARLMTWLDTQPEFARGRQAMFTVETQDVSNHAKVELRELFSHFNESIERAQANIDEAKRLSFTELMRKLDPDVFPDDS